MVALPSGWSTEEPKKQDVFLPEGWSTKAPPAPPERPSDSELQPAQWQKTRVPIAGRNKIEASDIPGAPHLLAATNLGGTSPEDITALQQHLSGIAEQEKAAPETEYSKARKEGKGFIEATKQDPLGMVQGLAYGAKQSIIPTTGAVAGSLFGPAGAVAGGGLSFGANAYANALINETRKFGGKLDDAKQFNDVYLKNKQKIDEAAAKEAAISGTEGAVFGLIPGGGGLKGMLGRIGVAYPSTAITAEGARRMAAGEPPQTPEEMLETGATSTITALPFEVAAAARGAPREGGRPSGQPPEGGAGGPALPPPEGGPTRGTKIDEMIRESDRQQREQAKNKDIEERMSQKELEQRNEFYSLLKGDGFTVDQIKAMDWPEVARRALDAQSRRVGPNPLRPQEKADLGLPLTKKEQGSLQQAPEATPPTPRGPVEAQGPVSPPAPAAPPSTTAADLVKQGVPPLEAIQEVGKGAPGVNPLEQPKPQTAVAQKPSIQDQINRIIGAEVSDRTNALVAGGVPHDQAVAQAGREVAAKYSTPEAVDGLVKSLGGEKAAEPTKPSVAAPAPPQTQPPVQQPVVEPPQAAAPQQPAMPEPVQPPKGKVEYATPKEAPKLDDVAGHTYTSMNSARFVDAVLSAPRFLKDNPQQSANALPADAPIKIRIDPSKFKFGGDLSVASAAGRDAIQQVIVGPTAFPTPTGNKGKKKAQEEKNKRLQDALNMLVQNGTNVVYVNDTNAPRRQAKGYNTLVGLARAMGGIRDYGGELKAMDLHKVPGVVNPKSKMGIEDFVHNAILGTDWYPDFAGNLVGADNPQPTPEMIQKVMDDLGQRRSFAEAKQKAPEEQEEEHYREGVAHHIPAYIAEQKILDAFGADSVFVDPDVLAYAVEILSQNPDWNPVEVYEYAHLHVDSRYGALSDEDAEEFLKGWDDVFNYRPAPPVGAKSRTQSVANAEPAAAPKVEEPRSEPQNVSPPRKTEGELTQQQIQDMIDAKLRPGYEVVMSPETERHSAGAYWGIKVDGKMKGNLLSNRSTKQEVEDWIDGVLRIMPEEAKKQQIEVEPKTKPLEELEIKVPDPFELAVEGKLSSIVAQQLSRDIKQNNTFIEDAILGDKAEEWRRLNRIANSSSIFSKQDDVNNALRKIDDIESALSKEESDALYGVNSSRGKDPELWSDLAQRLIEVEHDRKDALRQVSKEIRELSDNPALKDDSIGSWLDRERLAVIQHALAVDQKNGGNPRKFIEDAFKDYADYLRYNGIEPNDVAFMVKSNMANLAKILNLPKEPAIEAGAEGKPQLVLPGAERISQKEHAQRLAAKPMQGKVEQKEPEGLFGEGHKQIDLLSMPEAPKPVAKVEPPKEAPKDFGPIKGGHKLAHSAKIPKELAGVAKEWAEMLGIRAPIYLTTFDEARNNLHGGPWENLNKAAKTKTAYGSTFSLGQVDHTEYAAHAILIKSTGSKQKDLETLAHELGHILQKEAFDRADPKLKSAIKKEYNAWRKTAASGTIGDLLRSKKAQETIQTMLGELKIPHSTPVAQIANKKYWLSFEEYFADQVARWAMTSEKPVSVVEKFYKDIGAKLRELFFAAKKEGAFPNKTFKDFMDKVAVGLNLGEGGEPTTDIQYEQEVSKPEDLLKPQRGKVKVHTNGVLAQGLVDRYIDLFKVEQAYGKMRGAPLPDDMAGYLAQELFNNRVIARQDAVWKNEVQPLLDALTKAGIKHEDFAAFLYARHAPERNEVMRQRDPKRFGGGGGSGMSNETAKAILDKFRAPVIVNVNGVRTAMPTMYDIMDRLDRDFVRPMIRKDLDQRLQFGTITKEQYDALMRPRSEGGYNHYVPLRGSAEAEAEADENIVRASRNFGVSGNDFKIAFGRESQAFNPLFNAIQQRMEGIVRQEKNKVDNAIYKFVEAHPDNGMARIITAANAPTVKYLAADGTVHERVAFTPQAMETILPLKIDRSNLSKEEWESDFLKSGKKLKASAKRIGKQVYLQFDKDNPAMVRLVRELKGMPANAVNPVMNALFQVSRTFSRLNTSLVPDFFLTNFPRDVQDALMSMYGTKEGFASRFMGNLAGAAKIISQAETGLGLTEADRALYEEWVDSGGKLNYGGFKDIATVAKDFEKSMKGAFDDEATVKDKAIRYADKGLDLTIEALSKVNDIFEDTVRFAVYRTARQNGYSKERAASLSLNSTVNFQTKGAWMPQLNALKPFLSASVGSLRSVYRLAKNNPKRFGQFLAAVFFASLVNSLLGVWFSDKDEVDPTKSKYYTGVRGYERQKNWIIPYQFADGHYPKIPSAFYYGPMVVMGDSVAGVLTGNMTPQEAATNLALSIYDYANPMGTGTWASQLLFMPFTPFVQHAVNKDWLGRPIHPEETQRNKGVPASEQYGKNTPEWAIATSQYINQLTGGDKYTKGFVDAYPDTLNHYMKFFTGGLEAFAERGINAAKNYFTDTPTPVEELPYLRRLMTNTKGLEESKFAEVKGAVAEKENLFKSAWENYKTNQDKESYNKLIELGTELNIRKGKGDKLDMSKSIPTIFRKVTDQNNELEQGIADTRANTRLSPLEKEARVKSYEKQIKDNMMMMRKFMYQQKPSELTPLQQMFNR